MKKLLSFFLSLTLLFSLSLPTLAESKLKVSYNDVGQADSIFIELPNRQTMLIDAGTNDMGQRVVSYIRGLGYSKIDYLIGTHPHEDHIGGLDDVIKAFTIGKIFMPKATATTKTYEDVLTAIQDKGLKVTAAKAGVSILADSNLTADILAPVKERYQDLNDYSAVVKLTYGTTSFLFTGDAESEGENQITADVKADVLKVGHHGSNSSTSAAFLKKIAPKYAVISVGTGNTYGHPTPSTLKSLKAAGVKVYRTDMDGTIVATSDGKIISFTSKSAPSIGSAPTAPVPSSEKSPNFTSQEPLSASSSPSSTNSGSVTETQRTTVYVTSTGSKYHLDGCRFLIKSKVPMLLEAARGIYKPCAVCSPPA